MGDEFALLDPEDVRLYAFPRAVSLKNGAISDVAGIADETQMGPLLTGTPKGSIRHLRPRAEALERMAEPAKPTLILFPRFGRDLTPDVRPVGAAEGFVWLPQASTTYAALGEAGSNARAGLVKKPPARALVSPHPAAGSPQARKTAGG